MRALAAVVLTILLATPAVAQQQTRQRQLTTDPVVPSARFGCPTSPNVGTWTWDCCYERQRQWHIPDIAAHTCSMAQLQRQGVRNYGR